MFRRVPGPMVVAAITGIVSGVWIFKPMVDGSLAVGGHTPTVTKQEQLSNTSPEETKLPTRGAA